MFGHQDGQSSDGQPTAVPPLDIPLDDTSSTTIVQPAPAPTSPSPPPITDHDKPAAENQIADKPATISMQDTEDLLEIKEQALQQLSPLVDKLDQSPEEKFHTLMMMIQASDNETLIKQAYDIAQQITDKKEKAQALLDIVNEINYFTQRPSS